MDLRGNVNFPPTILTAGSTYYPFVVAAPPNQGVVIEGFGFYGGAGAPATPGVLSFMWASSQGSGGTVLTPVSLDQDITEAFQSSWISLPSTYPSAEEISGSMVNPQFGLSDRAPGDESLYRLKGGGFLAVQFVPGWTGPYTGWIQFVE